MRSSIKQQQLLESISILLNSGYALVKRTSKLFLLEGRLARRSLASIVALGFLLFGLSLTTWLVCLALVVLGLHVLLHSWILSLACTIILNAVLVYVVIRTIINYGKNLRFTRTRKHLFTWGETTHDLQTVAEKNSTVR